MSVMVPDLAIMETFVVTSNGGLEIHLYDEADIDGTGAGLYVILGNREESLNKLKQMYNSVLEGNKL